MHKQPERIGFFAVATGSVGFEGHLVIFDHQLHLASAAVDYLVEVRRTMRLITLLLNFKHAKLKRKRIVN